MSIYSGFGTRLQENSYNKLTLQLISLLNKRVTAHSNNEQVDEEAFKNELLKTYNCMTKLEMHKYLEPKYTQKLNPLVKSLFKEELKNKRFFTPKRSIEREHHSASPSKFKRKKANSRLGKTLLQPILLKTRTVSPIEARSKSPFAKLN